MSRKRTKKRRAAKEKRATKTAQQSSHVGSLLQGWLPRILAGLLGTAAVGGTAVTYNTGSHADERAARAEVRLDRVERDAGVTQKDVKRIDRRTTRIETMLEVLVPESKRPPRMYGPEE